MDALAAMKPLLVLLLLPCLGAAVIALLPHHMFRLIRGLALLVAAVTLLLSGWIVTRFTGSLSALQFLEKTVWRPQIGSYFALGVDGISLPMVVLATLLVFVALLVSGGIKDRVKGYYILILLLEMAMLGVFMVQDWFLFYIFWELTLIPLFFLINTYGGKQRHQAALNFLLYTMGGSVFMLIALLLAYDALPRNTFFMNAMALDLTGLAKEHQILIFCGFLIGLGVKIPIFPLHGWLPLAYVEAPTPVSILLSGVLVKMGSYGLMRVAFMLPKAVVVLQGVLAVLAVINIVYGGVLAWRQIDLKRMIAYASLSHMGVVLLGIATLNQTGFTGAMLQMVSHGLTAGLMFLVIGQLYERTHTRDIRHYGSLVRSAPHFAFFAIVAFFASVGMPGSSGFIAELHVMIGSWQRWGWWAALLSVGMLVSAAYAMRTIGVLCTGSERPEIGQIIPMRGAEWVAAGLLMVAIVFVGLIPTPLLGLLNGSIARFGAVFY